MSKNFRIYEAIAHEVADEAARRRELTPAQQAESRALYELGRAKLAAAERQLAARGRAPVRASILAMARDAIVQRLDTLLASHPRVLVAYRGEQALSDDDLRALLEKVERQVEDLTRPS